MSLINDEIEERMDYQSVSDADENRKSPTASDCMGADAECVDVDEEENAAVVESVGFIDENNQINEISDTSKIEMDDGDGSEMPENDLQPLIDADPMNLLELVETPYSEENDNEDTADLNDSDNRSQSELGEQRWQGWMEKYSWLLRDESDENCVGYCLYCDVSLRVIGNIHLDRHSLSYQHRDLEDSYLAFKSNQGEMNQSVENIKQELGNCSNVSAIRYRRQCEREEFQNFNWKRWQQAHPWLRRLEGNVGLCNICKAKFNAQFSYTREKHEESSKHQQAVNGLKKSTAIDRGGSNSESKVDLPEEEAGQLPVTNTSKLNTVLENDVWYEKSKNSNWVRCTLCNTSMLARSYRKHIKSNVHANNLHYYNQNSGQKESAMLYWKKLHRLHPWLCPDPVDNTFAYCKYCRKRLLYGLSGIKRSHHEKSVHHITMEKLYFREKVDEKATEHGQLPNAAVRNHVTDGNINSFNAENNDNDNESQIEEYDENGQTNMEDVLQANEEEADGVQLNQAVVNGNNNNDDYDYANELSNKRLRSKRIVRGSAEWLQQYEWTKKYPKDKKYCYCKYCNVILAIHSLRRSKHELTTRHIEYKKSYFNKLIGPIWIRSQKTNFCTVCRQHYVLNVNTVNHENSLQHKKLFDQLVNSKLHKRKLKVEKADTDIGENYDEQNELSADADDYNENAYDIESRTEQPTTSRAAATRLLNSAQPAAEDAMKQTLAKYKEKINKWKQTFTWLEFKQRGSRSFAFCTVCQIHIAAPKFLYILRHAKGVKHLKSLKEMANDTTATAVIKKQQLEQTNIVQTGIDNSITQAAAQAKSTIMLLKQRESIDEDQESQYPWLLADMNAKKGYCKYCEIRLKIRGSRKDRHENSPSHKAAERVFLARNSKNMPSSSKRVGRNGNESDSTDVSSGDNDTNPGKRIKMQDENIYEKAKRLTKCHTKLIRLLDNTTKPPLDVLANPFAAVERLSSVDINKNNRMSALPTYHNEENHMHSEMVTETIAAPMAATVVSQRNNIDLFFESISETMKKFDADLAAEGKLKVMEIMYDLEIRGLKRQQDKNAARDKASTSVAETASHNDNITSYVDLTDATVGQHGTNLTNGNISDAHATNVSLLHNNFLSSNKPIHDVQPNVRSISATTKQLSTSTKVTCTSHNMEANNIPMVGTVSPNPMNADSTHIRCVPINRLTQTSNVSHMSCKQRGPLVTHIRLNSGSNSKNVTVINSNHAEANHNSHNEDVRVATTAESLKNFNDKSPQRRLSIVNVSSAATTNGQLPMNYAMSHNRNMQ